MTQCEQIIEFLKQRGGRATLGELLDGGQFTFAHKLTARLSDLRKQGYVIKCTIGENPSKNLYTLEGQLKTEPNGQIYFG